MVVSRTGTTVYLRNRRRVLRRAQVDGLVVCPGFDWPDGSHHDCDRLLDYATPGTESSAEVDHVLEYRYGGTDDVENLRVLCRSCNLERNKRRSNATIAVADAFPTSREW